VDGSEGAPLAVGVCGLQGGGPAVDAGKDRLPKVSAETASEQQVVPQTPPGKPTTTAARLQELHHQAGEDRTPPASGVG